MVIPSFYRCMVRELRGRRTVRPLQDLEIPEVQGGVDVQDKSQPVLAAGDALKILVLSGRKRVGRGADVLAVEREHAVYPVDDHAEADLRTEIEDDDGGFRPVLDLRE